MTLRPTRTLTARPLTVRLLAVAGVAALGLGLAGCSGDSPDGKASASATTAATQKAAVTDVTTPAGGEGDYVGAVKDVQVTSCKRSGSSWAVKGTVANPEDSGQSYRIYVSLLQGQSDTRAVKEVDVDGVDAGATQDWDTTIDTGESGLSCVLRVERFAA